MIDPAGPPGLSRRKERRRRRRHRGGAAPEQPRAIEVTLTGFAAGGRALGHAPDGRVVFVEYGIPGERVAAEVSEEAASYLVARATAIVETSPHRVEPRCEYFGRCGGCQLQHVDYGEQIRLKAELVREQLRRIGGFGDPPVREAIGMEDPWAYRNHVRFSVRRGEVGFMLRGSHRFLRVDRCAIALPAINDVLARAQGKLGGLRELTVRAGERTGELLVQPRLPLGPDGAPAPVESGQRSYTEVLAGRRFRVSSPAFFQVNTRQAERLAALVVDRVVAARPRVAVDAYGGVGTFAALLAPAVPEVVLIEGNPAAGSDAEANLADLPNVRRVVGSVEERLPGLTPSPDAVVIDPPRVGCHRGVLDAIVASAARRVVYVSCDPATLARDLRVLADGGFALVEAQPVDLFPHTQHVECVAVLDRSLKRLPALPLK